MEDGRAVLGPYRDHVVAAALDDLPADADESARVAVGTALADHTDALSLAHPRQFELIEGTLSAGGNPARRIVHQAVREIFNVAHVDVLARAVRLRGRGSRPGPLPLSADDARA